jgi:hypothetical protein
MTAAVDTDIFTLTWKYKNANKYGRHIWWIPCHHGMARPQVADGADGLQIWRGAATIHI